jgi:hypothetical protein
MVQSAATPRRPVCQVWICAFTKPGMAIMPSASITSAPSGAVSARGDLGDAVVLDQDVAACQRSDGGIDRHDHGVADQDVGHVGLSLQVCGRDFVREAPGPETGRRSGEA